MKRITTMIITYNHEAFIEKAIESAVRQKGDFDHEILISDNGSTDGTRQIVREYAARHPRLIRDVSNDVNIGISGNMRKCFSLATGDYIAMLEGDDYWTDDSKLDKQRKFLEKHEKCSMVFSRIRVNRDGEFSLLPRHDRLPTLIGVRDLLDSEEMNPICNFSCSMFHARYIRNLPDVAYEGRLSEITVAFYMVQIGPIGYIDECLSDYRIHANGVFAGATSIEQTRQALQTFVTVKKIADISCWPKLTKTIEDLKCSLCDMNPQRVSIVTITYNNLEGLKKTTNSIVGQSRQDFEWIVIDGGSTDGSKEFLASLERQPDHWVSEPDNGIYDAMNKGIQAANGAYVLTMNAGDIFHSFETLKAVLEHGLNADVVYGDWVRAYPDHEEFVKAPTVLPPFFFFREGWNICQQAMFVRTSILRESPFDTGYRIVADWAKWRELMLEGRSFAYVPVTICDFEAVEGVSNGGATFRNINDTLLLRGAFPQGIIEESIKLQSMSTGRLSVSWWTREASNPFLLMITKPLKRIFFAFRTRGVAGAVRYAASLFLPFGCVRWWLKKRYGYEIGIDRFNVRGIVGRTAWAVKFLCPYGLVCIWDLFTSRRAK